MRQPRTTILFNAFLIVSFLTIGGLLSAQENTSPAQNLFETRLWTDATGEYQVSASFVEFASGEVTLRKSDGSEITIPLDRLSAEDIKYVKFHSSQSSFVLSALGIEDYRTLRNYIERQTDPQKVIDVLTAFIECPLIPDEEKSKAKPKLTKWEEIHKEQRIFVGNRWVLPTEYEGLIKDEARLIKEAERLIAVEQDEVAKVRLLEASKIHPGAVRADFTLGLLNALVAKHAPTAEEHFDECLNRLSDLRHPPSAVRTANLTAILNNLALSEIRQGNHRDAIKHLREASQFNPSSPELIQNLGRYTSLAGNQRLRGFPPGSHEEIATLYASLATNANSAKFDASKGWLYMRLTATHQNAIPKQESSPSDLLKTPAPESNSSPRQIVGNGTGFVVHPEYILTNAHVAQAAEYISIKDISSGNTLPANLVAIANGIDLALLHCPGLKAPSLPLAHNPPRRATEIMILGFPSVFRYGHTLKTTRGTVTSLPVSETHQMSMYDAGANPGNSGGPVCDAFGNVVGIATMISLQEAHNYSYGVPASEALSFLMLHIDDYTPTALLETKLEWPEVDERVSSSTMLVLLEKSMMSIGIEKRQLNRTPGIPGQRDAQEWNAYEDPWCMTCNGHGKLPCPDRSCARGTVRAYKTEVIGRNTVTGAPLIKKTAIRVRCNTCGGGDAVTCQDCSNGIERN